MNSNEPDVMQEHSIARNPEVAFDQTDLSASAVMLFLVALAIGGALLFAAVWLPYKRMAERYTQDQSVIVTREIEDPGSAFPEPRLQRDAVADLNSFRWQEAAILNGPEGVDPATGRKHIPIQQAIDQIAAEGLPVLSGDTKDKIQHRDTETQREAK